jgi:flagellar basal body-associated protein FliL
MMFLLLVTLTSILLAAIMSIVAWRISNDERRRSEARIAALAADIHGVGRAAPVGADDELELRPRSGTSAGADLFTAAQPGSGSRWPAVLAGGIFVLASAGALVIVLSGGSNGTTHASNQEPAAAPPPAAALPLELVALGHERDGDRLTVRGIVRNPPSGAAVDRLTAVVFLFDRDGGFLSTGRVTVESSALRPGSESIFVVTVPGAGDVGRYRVSFRTDDRIVPHLDRRASAQAKL